MGQNRLGTGMRWLLMACGPMNLNGMLVDRVSHRPSLPRLFC